MFLVSKNGGGPSVGGAAVAGARPRICIFCNHGRQRHHHATIAITMFKINRPWPPAVSLPASSTHHLVLFFRIYTLTFCLCDAFPKLFEPKSKKVARLTAELAALEAERLSKLVVLFGYEVSLSDKDLSSSL